MEVLGVPDDILATVRMVDKLTIHFQRPRNGGGEVKRVQFPAYSPGQAFVIFEEPEGRLIKWIKLQISILGTHSLILICDNVLFATEYMDTFVEKPCHSSNNVLLCCSGCSCFAGDPCLRSGWTTLSS